MSQIYFGNRPAVATNDLIISLDIIVSLAVTNLLVDYVTSGIIVDYNTIDIEVSA